MSVSEGIARKLIKQVHGKWILIEYDEDASRKLAGLPPKQPKEGENDDPASKLYIPDGAVKKGQDIREFEMVWKVLHVGPEVENSPVKAGDYVLAKGHAPKIFSNPEMRSIYVENVVATLDITE